MKTIGRRNLSPASPTEALRRAESLIAAVAELASVKRARGFVVKAKTRQAYEDWKRAQKNPRFW